MDAVMLNYSRVSLLMDGLLFLKRFLSSVPEQPASIMP